MQSLLLKFSLF